MNTTVTPRPSARGPDQLSLLLSFKMCLIGFPECPGREKGRELACYEHFCSRGRRGGEGSLISHRWTPPVAINQSRSPTGARRGFVEGAGGRGRLSLEHQLGLMTPSHREPPPHMSEGIHKYNPPRALLHSSSLLTQIDLGPV